MAFSETRRDVLPVDEETQLLVRSWIPDSEIKAVFLAIHGGMAHCGDWVTPALYFKDKGVATCAIDLRFHGTYPEYNKNGNVFFHIDSYDTYVHDISVFQDWISERFPEVPIFIIGHSNGALISLKYLLSITDDTNIKGAILSSPWLKNKVKVSPVMLKLSNVIASVYPTFSIKPPDLTQVLTHDTEITKRHMEDEKSGLRGVRVSAQLGVQSLKTQEWVSENIRNWENMPISVFLAGEDQLADTKYSEEVFSTISPTVLKLQIEEQNYHENFNELNRESIFNEIWKWMSLYI